MTDLLTQIHDCVIRRDRGAMAGLVRQALEAGLGPQDIINDALIKAMDTVGRDFAENKIFVPEMLVSAVTMKAGLELVKPLLTAGQAGNSGTVVMATVKGDLHDIGKNIVCMMLEGAGFNVVDLGVDLTVDKLLVKVDELKPNLVGLSALLTTTMPEMAKVVQALEAKGLRGRVKVIIGGAPVDAAFAKKIGADGYGKDAAAAVDLARRLCAA